jgi:hypothetical protein
MGHIFRTDCILTHVIGENILGKGRRGIDVSNYWMTREKRRYWKLQEEELDHTLWRTRFGRGCGLTVAQNTG